MKNIGILTFHWAENFGAVLQAYALQKKLISMGHECQLIDFRPAEFISPYRPIRIEWRNPMKLMMNIVKNAMIYNLIEKRTHLFESFRREYMLISKNIYRNAKELKEEVPLYSVYLVGSDQVWNPAFTRQIGDVYLLGFLPATAKKISYAASVIEEIPPELVEIYKNCLSQFNYISVREESSRKILQRITSMNIEVNLDPVFFLDTILWKKMCTAPKTRVPSKFNLVYDIERNHKIIEVANKVTQETGLPIISYSRNSCIRRRRYAKHLGFFTFDGPREFLWYVANAEIVITNSFHGLAFSLIFDKKYICVPHTTRGSRMTDLLRELGIERSICWDSGKFSFKNIIKLSEVPEAVSRLEKMKRASENYLRKAIEG